MRARPARSAPDKWDAGFQSGDGNQRGGYQRQGFANLECDEVKHVGPVFHGDTIYGESEVIGKWESKSKPDRGIVHVGTKGLNQNQEIVLTFKRKVLVPKKSFPAQLSPTVRS